MDDTVRAAALDGLARRVIGPYAIMSLMLFLLGLMIRFAPLPEIEAENDEESESDSATARNNIFQFPHLILGVLTLFFYVGVEVIAGDTIIRYGQAIDVPLASAKYFTSLVLVAMVVGYIIGILLIPKVLSQKTLLTISAISGLVFTSIALSVPVTAVMRIPFVDLMTFHSVELVLPYTVLFIALLGISNAIVWPAIWPLAIHGLGKFIKTGSALLIMGIAGGAIMPLIWGRLSDVWTPQHAYLIAIPCYLFILYFALHGYKVKSWKF
jgi:FHS family L-fucose permease-like MFS transporter